MKTSFISLLAIAASARAAYSTGTITSYPSATTSAVSADTSEYCIAEKADCEAQPNADYGYCSDQYDDCLSDECSATTSATIPWTTSTVVTTAVITISSCAPTVTNCPYATHPITTETVLTYTTYCPVETGSPVVYTSESYYYESTTSVVYTTELITISACAATVTNCPYTTAPVTTSSVYSYTTVCPVTETSRYTYSAYTAGPYTSSTFKPSPTKSSNSPVQVNNTTTPVTFTGAASAKHASGMLFAVGLAAAML